MVVLFYLPILLLFVASFGLGYVPVRLLGRLAIKSPAMGNTDTLAALAGAVGTTVGLLFEDASGYDRFAWAPERVREAWDFVYEFAQPILSGALCAFVVVLIVRFWPRWIPRLVMLTPLAGLSISFAVFLLWPVLFGPFVS